MNRTPGQPIGNYFHEDRTTKIKTCQHCVRKLHHFSPVTSGDSLKYHMHKMHSAFAVEMCISLPSLMKAKAPSSQHSIVSLSSLSQAAIGDAIVIDDDSPIAGPAMQSCPPLSLSSYSLTSPSSATSAESAATVRLLPLHQQARRCGFP